MNLDRYVNAFFREWRQEGIGSACRKMSRAIRSRGGKAGESRKKLKILVLTNRDSDNLGDQVMEACVLALIRTVMKNLGYAENEYQLISRAAGIISKKYVATKDPVYLEPAERAISGCDLLIFGGAPLFNYRYQIFYERTAVTLELAQKYQVPVLFSSIGVDGYDEDSPKCQRLKKTLNLSCVRQITTRDDLDSLEKYIDDKRIVLGRVADAAVFADRVFKDAVCRIPTEKKSRKKIGIFILRANGFIDNKVAFSKDDAAELWKELTCKLEEKNYDYVLLTSGHFGDEAFLDYLTTNCGMDSKKCAPIINTPEHLIRLVSSCDAVISTRLHPSIISYSLGIPSVGLTWNDKVKFFYESIGCADRALQVESFTADKIIEKLEQAISEGVGTNPDYRMSVYATLFSGINDIFGSPAGEAKPYTYEQLCGSIPAYPGTTEKEKEEKVARKLKRVYGKYNDLSEKYGKLRQSSKK